MAATSFDLMLTLLSISLVVGVTGVGLAALPWSSPQTLEVERSLVEVLQLGRKWVVGRLTPSQAARNSAAIVEMRKRPWTGQPSVCI